MICSNCKSKLNCGCQKKIASNSKEVCTLCIQSYEQQLLKIDKEKKTNVLKK